MNGNGNGDRITLKEIDQRLRTVEERIAEQYSLNKTLTIALQISGGLNVALVSFVLGALLHVRLV